MEKSIWRKKPMAAYEADMKKSELNRVLTKWGLTSLGIGAIIGGEGNGGIIYPEFHYGRDALVGIALFLTALAKSGKTCSVLRQQFPDYCISKNKIELTREINVDAILRGIHDKYKKELVNTIDGVKVDFEREWVHLRKSNTEPIIRIYAESASMTTADNLANKIITDIKEMIKEMQQ